MAKCDPPEPPQFVETCATKNLARPYTIGRTHTSGGFTTPPGVRAHHGPLQVQTLLQAMRPQLVQGPSKEDTAAATASLLAGTGHCTRPDRPEPYLGRATNAECCIVRDGDPHTIHARHLDQ